MEEGEEGDKIQMEGRQIQGRGREGRKRREEEVHGVVGRIQSRERKTNLMPVQVGSHSTPFVAWKQNRCYLRVCLSVETSCNCSPSGRAQSEQTSPCLQRRWLS